MANLSNINNILRTSSAGVGINCDAEFSLDIEKASANAILSLNSNGGSGAEYLLYSGTSGEFVINKRYVGDRLTISSGGDATFSGSATIETGINLESGVLVIKNATSDANGLRIFQDTSDASKIYNNYNGTLQLGVGNTTAITIDSSENTTFAGNIIIHNSSNAPYIDFVESGATTDSKARITMDQIDTDNGTLLFSTEGSGTLSERMRITAAGNVGIGTTSPYAFDTTATKLHVKNDSAGSGNVGEVARFEGSSDADGSGGTIRLGTSNDRGIYFEGGRTGSVPYGIIGTTEYNGAKTYSIYLQNTGNVGIGTESPSYKLDVYHATTNVVSSFKSGDNQAWISVQDDDSGTYGALFGTDSDANQEIVLANHTAAKRLVIKDGGNVGIGIDSPDRKLHVSSSENQLARFESTDAYGGIEICDNSSGTAKPLISAFANDLIFYNGGSSHSEAMRIASGNVGIGVTSPSAKLDVFRTINVSSDNDTGYVNSAIILNSTESSARGAGVFMHNTNDDQEWYAGVPYNDAFDSYVIGHKSTASHADSTSELANALLMVESGGNVGIGNTAPSWPLTVGGNVGFKTTAADGSENRFYFQVGGAADPGIFYVYNGAEAVTTQIHGAGASYFNGGNVGIGTTSPAGILTINGTGDAIRVESTNAGAGGAQLDLLHFTASPADGDTFAAINMGGYYTGTTSVYGAQVKSIWTDVSERHSRLEFTTCDTSLSTALTLAHDLKATFTGDLQAPRIGIGAINASFNLYNNGTSYFNGETTIDANLIMSQSNAEINFTSGNGVIQTTTASTSLTFGVNGSEKMRIHSTGDVLIGATNPTSYNSNADDLIIYEANDFSGITLAADNDQGSNIYFADGDDDNVGGITYNHTSNYMMFRVNGASRAEIDSGGSLTMSGDVIAYGSPSDKRLKENIKPIKSALDKVSKLQGVTFNWKESGSILELKEDVGFIAQDVQKVMPELVRENKDGMLSMRHQGIAPILLEAIKELKAEIEELKKQIK